MQKAKSPFKWALSSYSARPLDATPTKVHSTRISPVHRLLLVLRWCTLYLTRSSNLWITDFTYKFAPPPILGFWKFEIRKYAFAEPKLPTGNLRLALRVKLSYWSWRSLEPFVPKKYDFNYFSYSLTEPYQVNNSQYGMMGVLANCILLLSLVCYMWLGRHFINWWTLCDSENVKLPCWHVNNSQLHMML